MVSAGASIYPTSSSSSNLSQVTQVTNNSDTRASKSSPKRSITGSNEVFNCSPSYVERTLSSSSYKGEENCINDYGSGSTSSISEYLMETLPGWHVEDLFDLSFDSNGFCEVGSTPYNYI